MTTKTSDRQTELERIIRDTLSNEPALKAALEAFQIGQDEYVRAMANMKVKTIISSNTANLRSNNAVLGQHQK